MKTYPVSLPLIGLISGTRAMAAGGLALLLADKLDIKQRKAVGWTLLAVGLLTTIPLAAMLFGCCEKTQPFSQQNTPWNERPDT
jgi:4-amino-4-deoxy-L-arabinose transferase-like glycosyltransferase